MVLLLLQVLVLNEVYLLGRFNPFIYPLFILLLPFETPRSLILFLGFSMGIAVDLFSDTVGLHTAATVFMAWMRIYILRLIAQRDNFEPGSGPGRTGFGMTWFIKYTVIMILIHHLALFMLEASTFRGFGITMLMFIVTSLFSTLMIILSQLFMYKS
jgi:rod shape-determining protein MreD